ncbi:MAG: CDP-archaeol synthase [Nanoarchaeota archaeon]|nr:CDP-archaeol synthase [Nanoarchaeota archaeon]
MNPAMIFILKCIWHILPAYIANMSPVFAKKIMGDKFSAPIDMGKKFRGNPLFGKNKTYRGILSGVIIGIVIAYIQLFFYRYSLIKDISLFDYYTVNILLFGFLMGFGALLGDLVKSFFKRRVKFRPGESWIPFDQIDFLVGALLLSSLIYMPDLLTLLGIIIIMPIVKILLDQVGFYLGINKARL